MSARQTRLTLPLWTAIVMAAVEFYIHAVLAPSHLTEQPYIGLGFVIADILFALVVIGLLIPRLRLFAWLLGATVCLGMFVAFVLSRTTGLPGYQETWTSDGGLGLVSLPPELVFVGCAIASAAVRRVPKQLPHAVVAHDAKRLPASHAHSTADQSPKLRVSAPTRRGASF
jgi:hypothetical protein